MTGFSELITKELANAFEAAGYDASYARITVSNRPDLCEYQCNGAMAAKKQYGKAPRDIAMDVAAKLEGSSVVKDVDVAGPGFINFNIKDEFIAGYMNKLAADERCGASKAEAPETVVIDYGGPNVAKPLHIGHLRAAIIGESVKRLGRFAGHKVIGDVHLGDWGLQIGLIITELHERKPDLVYFDENYEGEYPEEAPFTISDLEDIYPKASARSKEDEDFRLRALEATKELQQGRRGYRALWKHIIDISVSDLKENYKKLNVEFDLWKGESDAQPYISDMVKKMKDDGIAYEDEGALIVDVKRDDDTKEMPPCIVLKSDGASLYTTTDLATLVEREQDFDPDRVIYVVDKRQELHFTQVFRTALKAGIVKPDTALKFLGFGTMNGEDGKPFKTRAGGVMRLEHLIADINDQMYEKIMSNDSLKDADDARKTADIVGLAALKYGDLSNQATKDYIFSPDKFTSFEGNTGPYILYTIVRIKSILNRYAESGGKLENLTILPPASKPEKDLMMSCTGFAAATLSAWNECAPHKLCAFIYELSNAFNHFYHDTRILAEEDTAKKESWIALLELVKRELEISIDLLGFAAPEKM